MQLKKIIAKSVVTSRRRMNWGVAAVALTAAATLVGCGGGSPADNPSTVNNPGQIGGSTLSFAYFQRCVNRVFVTPLQIQIGGTTSTNTCAGGGCHDYTTGAGGALRIKPGATTIDVTNLANTPAVIRDSDMYKNFYSAQAAIVIGSPEHSRLLNKPLVRGVLHGGGLIFLSDTDPNALAFSYWINHPTPQGQDEFSTTNYSMFVGNDPMNGACITQ